MAEPNSILKTKHADSKVGVLLVLGAAVLWSLNGALIKLVNDGGQGPSGISIAFYRSLFAGLFLLPIARGKWRTLSANTNDSANANASTHTKRSLSVKTHLRPAALWCVVFYTLMTVCFVVANTNTQAANAIILQYTSTFWIFGLSPLVLKEKPHGRDVGILALAVVGITIIFVGEATSDMFGLVNALGAGVFYALLTLMIRRLKNCDAAALTVLNNLGSALLIFPFVLIAGGLAVSGKSIGYLVFMGVVQFGLPYYLFSLGLARIKAYQASLITMAEPILVPVWAYLVVAEVPSVTTMYGGGIVFAALVIFFVVTRQRERAMKNKLAT